MLYLTDYQRQTIYLTDYERLSKKTEVLFIALTYTVESFGENCFCYYKVTSLERALFKGCLYEICSGGVLMVY